MAAEPELMAALRGRLLLRPLDRSDNPNRFDLTPRSDLPEPSHDLRRPLAQASLQD
jgi:hypothetical protein